MLRKVMKCLYFVLIVCIMLFLNVSISLGEPHISSKEASKIAVRFANQYLAFPDISTERLNFTVGDTQCSHERLRLSWPEAPDCECWIVRGYKGHYKLWVAVDSTIGDILYYQLLYRDHDYKLLYTNALQENGMLDRMNISDIIKNHLPIDFNSLDVSDTPVTYELRHCQYCDQVIWSCKFFQYDDSKEVRIQGNVYIDAYSGQIHYADMQIRDLTYFTPEKWHRIPYPELNYETDTEVQFRYVIPHALAADTVQYKVKLDGNEVCSLQCVCLQGRVMIPLVQMLTWLDTSVFISNDIQTEYRSLRFTHQGVTFVVRELYLQDPTYIITNRSENRSKQTSGVSDGYETFIELQDLRSFLKQQYGIDVQFLSSNR